MNELTGIVVLAAGSSSRLGQPKQLLWYKNTSLLKNTISQASKLADTAIIVVTGSNHELIQKEITGPKIKTIFNSDWELGMSCSIVKGLKELLGLNPDMKKVILAVCDQPYLTSIVFENLISEHQKTQKGIVACTYSETLGTPVLFAKKYFNELLQLKGQEGAKKIINRFLEDTIAVPFEKGNIDIDTIEDYNELIS
jgi:molybdenum cofactor cytidylyltransferase